MVESFLSQRGMTWFEDQALNNIYRPAKDNVERWIGFLKIL